MITVWCHHFYERAFFPSFFKICFMFHSMPKIGSGYLCNCRTGCSACLFVACDNDHSPSDILLMNYWDLPTWSPNELLWIRVLAFLLVSTRCEFLKPAIVWWVLHSPCRIIIMYVAFINFVKLLLDLSNSYL